MIENLFSVILFFSLGYISKRFRIFPESHSNPLIDFIIYVALPALVLYNVYHLHVNRNLIFVLLIGGWGAIVLSIVASLFLGKLLKLNKETLVTFIVMSTFGNTGFVGFPFVNALLGSEGLTYAVVFDQVGAFLPLSLLAPIIISFSEVNPKIRIDMKKIVTYPPFIALLCGLLIKGTEIPPFLLESLNTLGQTVIPLFYFLLG